ncbi:MAG: hypothetical protein MUC38_01240, partial [Cyclobacteriaceae bacterium]|nr:hypothetical protein [Cyclobacteriaceae bacterium]
SLGNVALKARCEKSNQNTKKGVKESMWQDVCPDYQYGRLVFSVAHFIFDIALKEKRHGLGV